MSSFESIKTTLILEYRMVKNAYAKFLSIKNSNHQLSHAEMHSSKSELADALDDWNILFLTLTDCMSPDEKDRIELLFTKKVNKVQSELSNE